MNKFMDIALKEAKKGISSNHGGPFGAVIVKDNKVIAKAHNNVIKTNDPTAHAEICAIRKATKKLQRFDLSDCELYTTCEPCPMCFSAIHWAKIKTVDYGCQRFDAEKIGFDDNFIYDVLKGKKKDCVIFKEIDREECLNIFNEWNNSKNKKLY